MLDLAAFLMLQASVAYERQLRCVTACTCGRGAARWAGLYHLCWVINS